MSRRYFAVSLSALWQVALGGLLALALVAGILPPWSSPLQASAETTSAVSDVVPTLSPAADRAGVVTLWQKAGPITQESARAALLGDDGQLKEFIDVGQYESLKQDYRMTVIQIAMIGRVATREAAENALAEGSWQVLQKFVNEGWRNSWLVDDKQDAYQVASDNNVPSSVRDAANDAIRGGDAAVQTFMLSGKATAEASAKRQEAYRLLGSSPSVKTAANKAIRANSPEAIADFLRYGQFVAAAQDAETATVSQLANQAKSASDQAIELNQKAKIASAQAVSAAQLAKAAAERAAAEAAAAKDSTVKAGAAAARAASLAEQAARAAQVAVGAAQDARRALNQGISAAANAAAAAGRAEQAAAMAQSSAAAAAGDSSQAGAARDAAQRARDAARGAQSAADAAGFAVESGNASKAAGDSAISAGRNAAAAASAAEAAAGASGVSSAEAAAAKAAAARARAAASRAEQASAQVNSLAKQASDLATSARTYALDAVQHANNAADNADEAARQAGNAAIAADKSRIYAEQAAIAANVATTAAEKARVVQKLARQADVDRLAAERMFNLAQAKEDRQFEADRQKAKDSASVQAKASAAKTEALIGKLTAPGADLNSQLKEVKEAVIGVAESGGPWQRSGAELAVASTPEVMEEFIVSGLKVAREQDQWDATKKFLSSPVPEVSKAADAALWNAYTDDASSTEKFLATEVLALSDNSNRQAVYGLLSSGGSEVRSGADAALKSNNSEEIQRFLEVGQLVASRSDDRQSVYALVSTAAPELKAAAEVAAAGPDSAVREFLRFGRFAAEKRDQEAAAHAASIEVLVSQADADAAQARAAAASAAQAAAEAKKAKEDAARYANDARKYADEARASADQALRFAKQAQESADQAAASAKTARDAATQARQDANAAATQAVIAQRSATSARASASVAAQAAVEAKASELSAGKSAQEAEAAATEALQISAEWQKTDDVLFDFETKLDGSDNLSSEEMKLVNQTPLEFIAEQGGKILLEFIGYDEAEACVTKFNIGACLLTAFNLIPWSKVLKAVELSGLAMAFVPKITKFLKEQERLAQIAKTERVKKSPPMVNGKPTGEYINQFVPDGMTTSSWGKIIWGRGEEGARALIGKRSADELRKEGLTLEKAVGLKKAYVEASKDARGREAALARVDLLQHYIDLLSK